MDTDEQNKLLEEFNRAMERKKQLHVEKKELDEKYERVHDEYLKKVQEVDELKNDIAVMEKENEVYTKTRIENEKNISSFFDEIEEIQKMKSNLEEKIIDQNFQFAETVCGICDDMQELPEIFRDENIENAITETDKEINDLIKEKETLEKKIESLTESAKEELKDYQLSSAVDEFIEKFSNSGESNIEKYQSLIANSQKNIAFFKKNISDLETKISMLENK